MKYIDAEKLKAELDKDYKKYRNRYMETRNPYTQGLIDALDLAEQTIDSLQEEQPEVDLEKEIETYFKGWYMDETDQGYILHTPDDHAGLMSAKQVARHFYELGLNARK